MSLNGMNAVFSFDKHKNISFHFWRLASARKITVLPESASPPGSYAYAEEFSRFTSLDIWT